jgi:1,4-alpha-glucan branching enzyme
VWAPNARAVRVAGEWNFWDGYALPMRSLGSSGVWELFVPGLPVGSRYKFEVLTRQGWRLHKADPLARATERPPASASVVEESSHVWGDAGWLAARAATDWLSRPMSVYEVHLGSWRRRPGEGNRPLTYRELADELPAYVEAMGFTHVELLPVSEHPFGGSWGYQVSAYFAPTARHGSPDDFRALVDAFHRRGIGVIVDWVPGHFPRDEWALVHFDGTALYEHSDPRRAAHPDWGTLEFNLGRREVRSFLISSARYWLDELHVDGLRVDAVASMLYLDYGRREGEWVPNEFGGREDTDAVSFIQELNEVVHAAHPGVMMVAEESTSWPAVSRPTYLGGLGFGFKWNMGWMHDTLEYFTKDPIYRRYHQGEITFGLLYAFFENFILPLSHDEVVHGKGSLLDKMPGDRWQKAANLRALLAWMWAHPGKQLLFMGGEFGQSAEWHHDRSLDWHLLQYPEHHGVSELVKALNTAYRAEPALWERDFSGEGFSWIDLGDVDGNVLSFLRFSADGQRVLACVANLAPVVRAGYRVGLPRPGGWREVLNTDAACFAGSGAGNGGWVSADAVPWHGQGWSAELTLPPLGVLWLVPG